MAKDRSKDNARKSNYAETRTDYFERKFGYDLANPKIDTHESEYEDANKDLAGEK